MSASLQIWSRLEMGMDGLQSGGAQTALIADDDEFFRAAARAILTSALGFSRVVEAGSFDEAVERLDEQDAAGQEISLALFDLSMPGIKNPANLRSIRETVPRLPIIVVSSSERRGDIISSLDAGVHGYVPKRLGIQELERAIGRVLAGDVYVPYLLTDVWRAEGETSADRPSSKREASATGTSLRELTPRQQDVLELIVKGKSNKEIARALGLGEGTVRVHMTALFRSLGVENRTAAAAFGSALIAQSVPADESTRSHPGRSDGAHGRT